MYGGKIIPVAVAIWPPYTVDNCNHILRIKTICYPNKNSFQHKYFLIQNNIIEQLIERKSNQLNSQ